jgi:hypothetical protein
VSAAAELLRRSSYRSKRGAKEAVDVLRSEFRRLQTILGNVPGLMQQQQQQQQHILLRFMLPTSPMSDWPKALEVT